MAARSSLRFAVGSLKFPRSSVWNLWVNRSDAYLTARSMAGTMKLSLHESGVWPVAWTAESGIVSPQTGHRRELTWRRPRPLANGWTEAPAVVIPHTGTTEPLPLSHEELTKPVVWVPGSRPGSAIRFGLVFSPPGIARADRRRAFGWSRVVGGRPLANGETIWVVAREMILTPESAAQVKRFIGDIQITHTDSDLRGSVFLFEHHVAQGPQITEFVIGPENIRVRVPESTSE